MSTGPTDPQPAPEPEPAPEPMPTTPADLYRRILTEDEKVRADQDRLKQDMDIDTIDHTEFARLIVGYGAPVVHVEDDGIHATIFTSDGGNVTTAAAFLSTAPPPAPTGAP